VSYNDTRGKYALVNVPHAMWQPINLTKKTHKALITCYQTDDLYCNVNVFPVSWAMKQARHHEFVLYEYEVSVSVTGGNAFIKINSAIVEVMKINKGTHCVDWTCTQSRNVSGIIHRVNQNIAI